jgi:hypothetical protein
MEPLAAETDHPLIVQCAHPAPQHHQERGNPPYPTLVFEVLSNHHDAYTLTEYHHRYPITLVSRHCEEIVGSDHEVPEDIFNTFRQALEQASAHAEQVYKARLAEGKVEMDNIPRLFKPGQSVVFNAEEPIAGRLIDMKVEHTAFGSYVAVRLGVIHGLDGAPRSGVYAFKLPGFAGVKDISSLAVRALDDKTKAMLSERGARLLRYLAPGTYVHYTGSLVQDDWWGPTEFRAEGRVVVDSRSFRRIDGNQWRSTKNMSGIDGQQHGEDDDDSPGHTEVAQTHLWMCMPYLYGFSMAAKRWGRMRVAGMSDIPWRTDAFDRVVMVPRQKNMVRSLVEHHGHGVSDLIDGKGGGCIFLLHGEPGGGKTLLAESVAELLKRPLYSVSTGELGTDPQGLELRLRGILDVATTWNAVILLDEADIFLEERDQHDVERNAMVGVFLRMLEYHGGVLFLTTNRVKNIDKAFYSRISVAIRFEHADLDKRTKIWNNLLEYAGLDRSWATTMGQYDVNGRQIKNSIRLAQTLALSEKRDVAVTDLVEAVEQALTFQEAMNEK